jgi:hypothetical protein
MGRQSEKARNEFVVRIHGIRLEHSDLKMNSSPNSFCKLFSPPVVPLHSPIEAPTSMKHVWFPCHHVWLFACSAGGTNGANCHSYDISSKQGGQQRPHAMQPVCAGMQAGCGCMLLVLEVVL